MTTNNPRKLQIVFIDDEVEICELFKELNEDEAIEIQTFSNPLDQLDEIPRENVDLYIIDYKLKGEKGTDLAEVLPTTIPKVLITAEYLNHVPKGFLTVVHKSCDLRFLASIMSDLKLKPPA